MLQLCCDGFLVIVLSRGPNFSDSMAAYGEWQDEKNGADHKKQPLPPKDGIGIEF